MKSLKEFILESKYINEAAVSKKATPLMKEIGTYFKNVHSGTAYKLFPPVYDMIVKECEKYDVAPKDKEMKEQPMFIVMKSSKDDKFLETIFIRPNKNGQTHGDVDGIGFCGFIEGGYYYPQTFYNVKEVKSYFKEMKRGNPIEYYKVSMEDAFSTWPKSSLEDACGGDHYRG